MPELSSQRIGEAWCGLMHESVLWPSHGHYQCRTCGREYSVPWGEGAGAARAAVKSGRQARQLPSFRSALLPLILALAILWPISANAAEAAVIQYATPASRAFALYLAGLEHPAAWTTATVEINASLPKLKEEAHLSAIRTLQPAGKPDYQVLEISGDRTVRQQVIARYLSAEIVASGIPAPSVAITPANYKFQFKRVEKNGDQSAYVFQITPRKKREGLIKGELWLDGETGAVVRQSGYLVKSPSIFVKRVTISRETVLAHGMADRRLTHLSIDTRLVGPAELTIEERPNSAPVADGIETSSR